MNAYLATQNGEQKIQSYVGSTTFQSVCFQNAHTANIDLISCKWFQSSDESYMNDFPRQVQITAIARKHYVKPLFHMIWSSHECTLRGWLMNESQINLVPSACRQIENYCTCKACNNHYECLFNFWTFTLNVNFDALSTLLCMWSPLHSFTVSTWHRQHPYPPNTMVSP